MSASIGACVLLLAQPRYEGGILQLGEQHVNKKYLKAILFTQ